MRTYLRGKAAGKQNFGYVKCTTKKDKQKKINKKASIHKVKFLMNTRYGRGDRVQRLKYRITMRFFAP